MFPLGSVLFPSVFLPLHVFEPRYRVMIRRCVDTDSEFGVVLIERGSEVGGHDVRTMVGTAARIIEAREFDDGRWAVGAVGTRRIRVRSWLPDDPYPRADVEDADTADAEPGDERDGESSYQSVVVLVRRALALLTELGEPAVSVTVELTDDWRLGSYQAAAVAPIGPADQQRLLALPTALARIETLAAMLDEEIGFLERRLSDG
jgi:Lon protease-like protein